MSSTDQFRELDHLYGEFGFAAEPDIAEATDLLQPDELIKQGWGDDDIHLNDGATVDAHVRHSIDVYLGNAADDGSVHSGGSETDTEDQTMDGNAEVLVTCTCKDNCISKLNKDQINEHILSLREMDKDNREMFIMGALQKIGSEETRSGKRKRMRYRFAFSGTVVCKTVFCYVNDIGKRTLKSLQKHLSTNGAVPRVHGNTGRKPHNAVRYTEVRFCVDFLMLYTEIHGLPMPAAPRGHDEAAPVFLPAHLTKVNVHTEYKEACRQATTRVLGITSFKEIWKNCVPHIKIMSAKEDVCHKCELLRKKVTDARLESEKLKAATDLQEHVQDAQTERQVYRTTIEEAVAEMSGHVRQAGPVTPLSSHLRKVHYTFDYSQNVTIPHHARQMGPMYFLTGRKIQLFGVRVDSVSEQYNYLIDEDESIGQDGTRTHGPNAVISMVHHCLEKRGFGERACVLHADNCGAQNKNRFMVAYLCWRIHLGLHEEITLLMGIPGHTKCLVDGGFGHIKRLFRRSDSDSLAQVATLVEKSSTNNYTVLFRDEAGSQNWNWYDWKSFLPNFFLPLRGIKKMHSFRFTAADKNAVFVKERSTGNEIRVPIVKRNVDVPRDFPDTLPPAGLSRTRQQYLYRHVRPFVRPAFQDSTCPGLPEE